jgi:integrase
MSMSREQKRTSRAEERAERKAANDEISREMREAREKERSSRQRGAGQWTALLKTAEKDRKGDIFRQFAFCMRNGQVPAGIGRKRNVGDATQRKFATDSQRSLNDLRKEGIRIQNLSELRCGHVITLIKRYLRVGKAPSTINGRVGALRKLCVLLGRPGEVPTGAAWKRLLRANGIDPRSLERSQIRVVPKSVSSKGLKPEDVIARVDPKHAVERLWLLLMWLFGLRPRECAELDPLESDRSDHLLVLHGAKANRKRAITFSNDPVKREAQRRALDEARRMALEVLKHPQWKLRDREHNTEQALNHFYYVTRKSGLTKADLGIIPYCFRHEFANAEFEEVAGVPPPVLRKTDVREYKVRAEAVAAAKKHVTNQLGHSDVDKGNSYNGSVHEEERRLKRQYAVLNMVSANKPLALAVERARVQELWLVGKAATGDKLGEGEPIRIVLHMPDTFSPAAMQDLASAVEQMSRPVLISMCSTRPDRGLEVVFPHQRRPGTGVADAISA